MCFPKAILRALVQNVWTQLIGLKMKEKKKKKLQVSDFTSHSFGFDDYFFLFLGFQPVDCPTGSWVMKGGDGKFFCQSAREYRKAIKAVQNTPLPVLRKCFEGTEIERKWNGLFNIEYGN